MNNYQWLLQMDGADRKAWFDAEHVEHQEQALDGDTDALERKSADLIHEYYKPMVAELKTQVDELEAKREHQRRELAMFNNLVNTHGLAITDDCWDYRSVRELCDENDELQTRLLRVEADCERYRSKFGKCLDYADAIHALMDDEGMA